MRRLGRAVVATVALAAAACAPRAPVTRLSIATGGTGGVYYPLGGALARLITNNLPGVEATAEATAASVDNLKFLQRGEADLAFTLADTLDDAVRGRGAFTAPVPLRALAVLYPNATQIVVRPRAPLRRVADLRGRVVSTGAPGSGTEVIALRLLAAAGLDPARDLRRESLGAGPSAEAFKDGKLDAFFWSGGLPTAAILDLAHTAGGVRLLPCDEALPALRASFGPSLYAPLTVPRRTYAGMDADVASVGVANVLVTRADLPETLAYEITRLLFEKKAALEAVHAEAKNITREGATSGSPAEFHAGALRYYREAQP
jgi:TRAP transporter TAXI family solute receptor